MGDSENSNVEDNLGVARNGSFAAFRKMVITPMFSSLSEMGRLFPDSILFGSLLLYLLTQHLPYGVFGIFLLETSVAHRLVNFFVGTITTIEPGDKTAACRSGFHRGRLEFERTINHTSYPSVPVFFTGAVATYLYGALITFTETLKTMGPDCEIRMATAAIFIALSVGLFIYSKMGCHTMTELAIAFGSGAIVGMIFYYINYKVFGVEGINFLGLPYLIDKTSTNNTLYVCVPNSVSGK
jgi:hypothetical protein